MTISVLDDSILTRMESHTPAIDTDLMLSSLKEDNAFFKEIIDLVPATFYFDTSTKEKLFGDFDSHESSSTAGQHGKRKRNHEGDDYKKRTKHAKFDPTQMMTVTKIQERLEQQDSLATNKKDERRKKKTNFIEAKSTTDSLEDLRERLQRKIEMLRGKRKAMTGADYVERKRLKRRESKMKLKMRKQAAKGNVTKGEQGPHAKLMNGTPTNSPPRPVYNKEGKMVFSKFDFSETPKAHGEKKGESKNYKRLLEKVMKEKDKMAELSETDKDAAKVQKEKTAWKKALQMAEGVKVKDNPELLKKSIKQQEKKKKKSAKEWDERKAKTDKKMADAQAKRAKNIGKKKQSRKDSKVKKSKKKGRVAVPGF